MSEFNPYAPSQVQQSEPPANLAKAVPLTPNAYAALIGSKVWVRIISIMFFAMAAIVIIAQIIQLNKTKRSAPFDYPERSSAYEAGEKVGSIIGLLILLTILILPGLRLHTYAKSIGLYFQSKKPQDLDKAMESQTKYWRLMGILTIIYIIIMLLAILFG